MDSAKLAVEVFVEQGVKRRELDNILASNSVVDWFGRTIKGRQNIVNFFLDSNVIYEHSFSSVETTQAFEDRKSHMTTRQMPLENRIRINEIETDFESSPSWEKGADCTPTNKTCIQISCPPAPNRNLCSSFIQIDSDESSNSNDCDLSGIHPIDTSIRIDLNDSPIRSPRSKKRRIDKIGLNTSIIHEEQIEESTHTSLKYLKAVGTVASNRQNPEKFDERECTMFMSYRERRDNQNDVQISLIVYKPNSKNVKSRRNLLSQFGESSSTTNSEQEKSKTPIGKTTSDLLKTPSKSSGKVDNFRSTSSKKRQLDTKMSLRF